MRGGPLIPRTPEDARALWGMIVGDIEERVRADATAIRLMATECVAHSGLLLQRPAPGVRTVVLHGPDPGGLVRLATAAADAMDLPHVVVPLTSVSESGWQGRSLADWLKDLEHDTRRKAWIRRGVVVLSGLDALRIESGSYRASSTSTRDYRTGKAENIASLLRGEPVPWPSGGTMWDAQRALVVLTTTYGQPQHDADALADWGLIPELARALATATWIHVPEAQGRVAEYEIWDAIQPMRHLYAAFGILLDVSDEAVRRAALQAAERGETPAVAASWIVAPSLRRLMEMLESGDVRTYVVIAPDDCPAPPRSPSTWAD